MPQLPPRETLATHEVTNQPPPWPALGLWTSDPALQTHSGAAGADSDILAAYGERIGDAEMRDAARIAQHMPPELRAFDAAGRRIDEVSYSPGYHTLLDAAIGGGYSALAWEGMAGSGGGHATHAAMVYLTAQIEPGVCGPMTMTYAGIPALEADDDLFSIWVPKLISRAYDTSVRPLAQKSGAMLSIATGEKQGGSDLTATTTRATRDGSAYRLQGHKWFCSAPMADGILTLAQTSGGLSAFMVPRWLDDRRNAIELQRLKGKLGNHANATAEIEFTDALAFRLGDEGRGLEAVASYTPYLRLDAALTSAGLMRAALARAAHWVEHRQASDRVLLDQPLMRQVVADLVLDWDGALGLGLYAARFLDAKTGADRAFAKLVVAMAKYLNTRICPGVVREAMEVMGGTGYIEDSGMPVLYREAPLPAIWDGGGNRLCLDVLRLLHEEPVAGEMLGAELGAAAGHIASYDAAVSTHMARFPRLADPKDARWYVESLASLLTASVLIRYAPDAVAAGYVTTRLGEGRGRTAGAIPKVDDVAVLSRLQPS